jgi:predicted alpha/beta-hydrolase family hydrolase
MKAILNGPKDPKACLVLAHGAGAGMKHPFMTAIAQGLAGRGITTLRYEFPYMERGDKRPDPPPVAQKAVRAACAEAAKKFPGVPLFAGGKSFGGRMTSQAQAESPLEGVRGIIFLGFPLHAPGKPSNDRAEHLFKVQVPMLFLQGARDEFAQLDLLQPLIDKIKDTATLKLFADADHSFHVPASSGRNDQQVREEMLDAIAAFIAAR